MNFTFWISQAVVIEEFHSDTRTFLRECEGEGEGECIDISSKFR
jgi:hypothetical protein